MRALFSKLAQDLHAYHLNDGGAGLPSLEGVAKGDLDAAAAEALHGCVVAMIERGRAAAATAAEASRQQSVLSTSLAAATAATISRASEVTQQQKALRALARGMRPLRVLTHELRSQKSSS